jgi:hypothetical protein
MQSGPLLFFRFVAKRFPGLIPLHARLKISLFVWRRQITGFRLPPDSALEVAELGVPGRERIDQSGMLPFGEFARLRGVLIAFRSSMMRRTQARGRWSS